MTHAASIFETTVQGQTDAESSLNTNCLMKSWYGRIDVEDIWDSRSTLRGVFEQMSERTIAIRDVALNGELDHCWQRRPFVCRSVSVVRSDQQSRSIRLDKLGLNNVVCDKGLKSRRSDKCSEPAASGAVA